MKLNREVLRGKLGVATWKLGKLLGVSREDGRKTEKNLCLILTSVLCGFNFGINKGLGGLNTTFYSDLIKKENQLHVLALRPSSGWI
jgi:hypothetical protein